MLWGEHGCVDTYDVPVVWRDYATAPRTQRIDSGHFLPEEAPAEVLSALLAFLQDE